MPQYILRSIVSVNKCSYTWVYFVLSLMAGMTKKGGATGGTKGGGKAGAKGGTKGGMKKQFSYVKSN